MTKIRTLMVDDSPEFIEAASRFLSIDPNIEVVAKIHHGAEVIEKVNELNPDIVLLDLAMPDLHGLEVLKHLKQQCASAPLVIILTLYDNPEYRAQAIALGASSFIYKSDFGVELLPTIRALMTNREQTTQDNGSKPDIYQNNPTSPVFHEIPKDPTK